MQLWKTTFLECLLLNKKTISLTILDNYKDSFVGNYKDNTERAKTSANKSMGFDTKATQSCFEKKTSHWGTISHPKMVPNI